MDEKIRAEFFSRRFSLMQGTILGQIVEELNDDVFVKLITAFFHTVTDMLSEKNNKLNGLNEIKYIKTPSQMSN